METILIIIIGVFLLFILLNLSKIFSGKDKYQGLNKELLLKFLRDSQEEGLSTIEELRNKIILSTEKIKKFVKPIDKRTLERDHVELEVRKKEAQRNDKYYTPKLDIPKNLSNEEDSTTNTPQEFDSKYFNREYKELEAQPNIEQRDVESHEVKKRPKQSPPLHFTKHFIKFLKIDAIALLGLGSCYLFLLFTINVWPSFNSNLQQSTLLSILALAYVFCVIYFNKQTKVLGIALWICSLAFPALFTLAWIKGFNSIITDPNIYGLVISIFTIIIFSINLFVLKIARFISLIYLAVFSFFFFLSSIISTDTLVRLALIINFNFFIYIFANNFFKSYGEKVKYLARVVNQIFNILVAIYIIRNFSAVLDVKEQLIGILTILIPTIFEIYSFNKDKSKWSSDITIIDLPLKIVLAGVLFNLSITGIILFVLIYLCISTIITQYFSIRKKEKNLYIDTSNVVKWVVILLISATLFASNSYIHLFSIELPFQLFSLIVMFVLLVTPEILRKRYQHLSILLVYLCFIIFQVESAALHVTKIQDYFITSLSLLLISFIIHLFLVVTKRSIKNILLPFLAFSATAAGAILAYNFNISDTFAFLTIITFIIFVYSYMYKSKYLKIFLSFSSFLAYFSFLSLSVQFEIFDLFNYPLITVLISVPLVISLIIWNKQKLSGKNSDASLTSALLHTLSLVGYSFITPTLQVWVLGIALLYFIYSLLAYQNINYVYLVFLLSNVFTGLLIYLSSSSYLFIFFAFSILCFTMVLLGSILILRSKVLFYTISEKLKTLIQSMSYLYLYEILLLLVASVYFLLILEPGVINIYFLLSNAFILGAILLAQKRYWTMNLFVVPLLLIIWHLGISYNLYIQYYIVTLCGLLLMMSFIYYKTNGPFSVTTSVANSPVDKSIYENNLFIRKFIEYFAYVILFASFIIESIYNPNLSMVYGIALIIIAGIIFSFAVKTRNTILMIITGITILGELVVRFYVILIGIPLWTYLVLAILAFFDFAMYIFYKIEKSKKKEALQSASFNDPF